MKTGTLLHIHWRQQYRARRYARHLSRPELNKRIRDIVLNLLLLTPKAKIGLLPVDLPSGIWMEKWTHVLEEMALRYGPYPAGFDRDILHSEPFPNFASELARKATDRMSRLNNLVLAAERAGEFALAHGFAQAVHHEPRGLVADTNHAVHLMGADALLGGAQKESGHQPFVKRDMAGLKEGADCDGELLAAAGFVALIPAGAGLYRRGVVDGAAGGANRAFFPQVSRKPIAGLVGVLEDRIV